MIRDDYAIDLLWDGMAQRQFSESDLASLGDAFDRGDPLGERVLTTLRFERAFLLQFLDQVQSRSTPAKGSGRSSGAPSPSRR